MKVLDQFGLRPRQALENKAKGWASATYANHLLKTLGCLNIQYFRYR